MTDLIDGKALLIGAPCLGDGEGMARAWLDAGLHYASQDPEAFQVPKEGGLAAWLEAGALKERGVDSRFFVADLNGTAVGILWATVQRPIPSAEWQFVREIGQVRLIVEALVVQLAYWRRGVGTRLMQNAEEWGRERGAEVAVLDTYAWSDVSVPFYERRMGYRRRALRFTKRLTNTSLGDGKART